LEREFVIGGCMNAIETNNLTVRFDGIKILDDLSINVPSGTVCALLGPNGAGKTTLIKTLVNIYKAEKGSSKVLGVSSSQLSPKDFQKIGYVSESQEIPLWMTVKGFLSFCKKLYPNWDDNWCDNMLKEMDLSNHLYSPLKKLSRGMRVKAILISSLAYHPELLILDEPFSGLDPVVRDEFIEAVIALAAAVNATTFISSHDLNEVERIADSIAFLHHGKIVRHEELDKLLASFKFVTLEYTGELPTCFPSTWLKPKRDTSFLRFVNSSHDDARFSREMLEVSSSLVIKSVEDMTLKEIYRVLAGKNVL